MGILKHESKHWPLALVVARGEPTLEQHFESLAAWDEWFSRAEPFRVIRVYCDNASLHHAKGAAQATQEWLNAGAAEKMRELVQSMLIVVPPDRHGSMAKMSVQKAFGVPGGLFPSLEAAFAWNHNPTEPAPLDIGLLAQVLRATVELIAGPCEESAGAGADKEKPGAYSGDY